MMKEVFLLACGVALLIASSCSFPVQVDKPKLEIDCVVVELPGGQVMESCDGGVVDDGGAE